jgi:hypothetical protein
VLAKLPTRERPVEGGGHVDPTGVEESAPFERRDQSDHGPGVEVAPLGEPIDDEIGDGALAIESREHVGLVTGEAVMDGPVGAGHHHVRLAAGGLELGGLHSRRQPRTPSAVVNSLFYQRPDVDVVAVRRRVGQSDGAPDVAHNARRPAPWEPGRIRGL